MATLPQELIDAIVDEVGDNSSLKTCSLVGNAFRQPSQRILLHSLTLGEYDKPFTVALAFLRESPHIAPYITRLHCTLPTVDTAPGEIQALSAILLILRNVRYCQFRGRRTPALTVNVPQPWNNIPLSVSAAVLAVIQRGSLEFLDVICVFSAAQTLSLRSTSVEGTSHEPVLPPPKPVVQNLHLQGSLDAVNVLLSRQFESQRANIRKLWWDPVGEHGERLISAVASTIKHIWIDYPGYSPSLPVPALPVLQSAEITAYLDNCDVTPTIEHILSVLKAAPQTLKEISIKCATRGLPSWVLLGEIDTLVIESAACPRVRCRVDLRYSEALTVAQYAAALQLGMPRLYAEGKLEIEQCSRIYPGSSSWAT
ncbi:hypothetical protein DFH06DRAFT_1134495 [Mycena polygramma]|nr:hypothetical protein DFH06DRAFT_1134495 [Mycena polygramma]